MIDQNQILWDERNLTELQNSYKNKNEQETSDITKDIKTSSMPNDWRNITDPKLRKKMQNRAWDIANPEKKKRISKNYYETNREKYKNYREIHKNEKKMYDKAYRKANRDKINKARRDKKKNDPQYKLSILLRNRIRNALKGNYKSGSAIKDLGCSIEYLKNYLESKFQEGMSWENWAHDGWHIDHIKPLASFDLSDRIQFLQACNYTNLQPLWAKDNIAKSDKINYF